MSSPYCCAICFWSFPIEELYVDADGTTWDICKDCGRREDDIHNRLLNGESRESIIANPLPLTEGEKFRHQQESEELEAANLRLGISGE